MPTTEEGPVAQAAVGVVQRVLERDLFQVQLEDGRTVVAHLAPQLRMLRGRILEGYRVWVEVSRFDRTRGRIVASDKGLGFH